MSHINFEFKARAKNLVSLENKLLHLYPHFIGEDKQTDTYFNVVKGRLKLREGNIENALIYYEIQNVPGAKKSDILLYEHQPDTSLKNILTKIHGIKVIVKKVRKIYFIENVKFHFDTIEELGTFIEVEAIDSTGEIGSNRDWIEKLKEQCRNYANLFKIKEPDYISFSYSDMILDKMSGMSNSNSVMG